MSFVFPRHGFYRGETELVAVQSGSKKRPSTGHIGWHVTHMYPTDFLLLLSDVEVT